MTCEERSKRDQILMTAWRLFESQGYHATGINQIITESGVPKGSFYHYFPEGKEGLACEAIEAIGEGMRSKVRWVCSSNPDPVAAITALVRGIADRLERSEYQHGGPLTTVTLETASTNERINAVCQAAYEVLQDEITDQLVGAGFTDDDARELSTVIVASLEGGILLSRTSHSREPMERVARQIESILRARQPAL